MGPSSEEEAEPAAAVIVAAEQSNAVEAPTPIASRLRLGSRQPRRTRACVATACIQYRYCSGRIGVRKPVPEHCSSVPVRTDGACRGYQGRYSDALPVPNAIP